MSSTCRLCPLHRTRRSIVRGRGDIPCDVLIAGEAPGRSEDVLGKPFVGRGGKLLDAAIEAASILARRRRPRVYITNVVACRPCDTADGENRPPSADEVWACSARFQEEAALADAERVILLGKTAQKAALKLLPAAICLPHPAYILRVGGRGCPAWTKFVRDLSEVFRCLEGMESIR